MPLHVWLSLTWEIDRTKSIRSRALGLGIGGLIRFLCEVIRDFGLLDWDCPLIGRVGGPEIGGLTEAAAVFGNVARSSHDRADTEVGLRGTHKAGYAKV